MRFIVLLSLLLSSIANAKLFGAKTGVPELSARNFRDEVLYNGNVTAVVFYAPWCGYCQQLSSEWKKTAKSLKGIARVVAVDCDADVNKPLCAKYNVKGFPTIKVFQPAKLTDKDLKSVVVDGNPLPRRRPTMYSYDGPRESKAITKFVVSHLRNYVASLETDESLKWLAVNKIPRVIMLPGKRYKSRNVSPLFKALSREYFGKLRFAQIPRRVDGAWNLLGMKAPEDSQLVYLSDDRTPVVYKGSMKKEAIKQFLDEQYGLEMNRRKHKGGNVTPDRDNAGNGLEFVLEDQQTEELEHLIKQRELEKAHLEAAKEAKKAAFARYGKEIEDEELTEPTTAIPSTTTALSQAIPTPTAEEGEEAEDFEYTGTEESDVEPGTDAEGASDEPVTGNGNGEGEEEEEEIEEVLLDSTIVELTPDQIVQEGPEAIASYLAKHREESTATATAETKTVDGEKAKASPTSRGDVGIDNFDQYIQRCVRRGFNCAVMLTTHEKKDDDLLILLRALERMPIAVKQRTVFDFMYTDENSDIQEFLEAIDVPQRPALLWWEAGRRRFTVHHSPWAAIPIEKFVRGVVKRDIEVTGEIPNKFLYWLTEAEVEAVAEAEAKLKEESKHQPKSEL